MVLFKSWIKQDGPRLQGSRDLDSSKLQSPCIVRIPSGGFRLFHTAVGPAKPYPECQGYILSAVSEDGLTFEKEPGIRLAPQPGIPHMSLRVISPSVTQCVDGRWRMYFESRGPASIPTVICSAISSDMLDWELEEGIRFQAPCGVGGVRYLALPDGRGRFYCFESVYGSGGTTHGTRTSQGIVSAITSDGLNFEKEPGYRVRDKQSDYDSAGITTSIAADMSGFRSRIFFASSVDGLKWGPMELVLEGAGYGGEGLDAVHAEDMSLIQIASGRYRMYYAACDAQGRWCVASAINCVP